MRAPQTGWEAGRNLQGGARASTEQGGACVRVPCRRVADGTISMDEAVRRNNQHFKRLYGADKPANMFF